MLAQHLRVVVDHLVRRMSAPIANDLTAHPGINKVRNPASPKSVHPHAGLNELQLPYLFSSCRVSRRRRSSAMSAVAKTVATDFDTLIWPHSIL